MSDADAVNVKVADIQTTDFLALQDFLRFRTQEHQRMMKLSEALERVASVIQWRHELERLRDRAKDELDRVRAQVAEEESRGLGIQQQSAKLLKDAQEEAVRIRNDAKTEAARLIQEAQGEVEAKQAELAELQGRVDRIAQALQTK